MKYYFLLLCTFVVLSSKGTQMVYVPDSVFRNYIATIAPGAITGDSMNADHPVISNIDSINISGLGINSIQGIQYFDSLHILEAAYNNLTNIQSLPFRILAKVDGRINLNHNPLQHLGGGQNNVLVSVWNLDVSYCQLTGGLGFSSARWIKLNISHNNLSGANYFNESQLRHFNCSYNNFSMLQVGSGPVIQTFDCSHNVISNVVASSFTSPFLTYLNCSHNQLQSLPAIPANVKTFNASSNLLYQLPALPAQLDTLIVDSNSLYNIMPLPLGLEELHAEGNHLMNIDSLPHSLRQLFCRNNNLLCLPYLPATLVTLRATGNYLNCIPNLPPWPAFSSDVGYNGTGYDICASSQCQNYSQIRGHIYFDINIDSVQNQNEASSVNSVVQLLPFGYNTLTDTGGNYVFYVNPGIMDTIKPKVPPDYASDPPFVPILLTAAQVDTANVDFRFYPTWYFSDVQVFITQVIHPQPDHVSLYQVTVKNKGTRFENGLVNFMVDTALVYDSSMAAGVLINDTIRWAFSNLIPGTSLNYLVFLHNNSLSNPQTHFQNKASVTIQNNDTVPVDNVATNADTIASEYQRNRKRAYPENFNSGNLAAGDRLDYLIQFQNTDTAAIANVTIVDTLSPYLDPSTLEIVAASFDYNVQLNGQILTVSFAGINLPDSLSEPVKSHGFFRFTVRPFSNVNLIGNITNVAWIFFDGKGVSTSCGTGVCLKSVSISSSVYPVVSFNCSPISLGSISITTSAPLTSFYQWSNGSYSSSIDSLFSGDYYCTVTNECNASVVGIFHVDSSHISDMSAGVDTIGVSCFGIADGAIMLTGCGNDPLHYFWNTGDTTPYLIGLHGGTYSCTITDAFSSFPVEVVLAEPTAVNPNLNYYDCDPWNPGTGYIEFNPSGGDGIYSIVWNDGSSTFYRDGLSSGNYSFTLSDSRGCVASDTVEIQNAAGIVINQLIGHNPTCLNPSNASVEYHFANLSPFIGIFIDGSIYIPDSIGSVVLPSGTHTLSFVNWLTTCSVDTTFDFYPIDDSALALNVISYTPYVCNGQTGEAHVAADGGLGGYVYDWNNGINGPDLNFVNAGTYSCTVYDPQCSVSATVFLTPVDTIDVQVAHYNDVSCAGLADGSISIEGGSNYNYTWSTGQNGPSIGGLAPGFYTCTVTDANACTASVSQYITQPTPFSLAVQTQDELPCGSFTGSITAIASGGVSPYTYSWNNGITTDVNANLGAGNYQVSVYDNNNCFVVGYGQVNCLLSNSELPVNQFKVYPNPAGNFINLLLPDQLIANLRIYSLDGIMLYSQKTAQTDIKTLDISRWPKGSYMAVLQGENQLYRALFLKQ